MGKGMAKKSRTGEGPAKGLEEDITDPTHEDEFTEDLPTCESNVGVLFRERERRPAFLEMLEGPGAPCVYMLERVEMVVGRGAEADIQVDSTEVSRRHMRIGRAGTSHQIQDLESRNGVLLNGVRIHSASLHEGDTLQLGNAVFVYHEGQR